MLPVYKLLSLLLRVTSRPLINLTKRYHANNQIQNDLVRRLFYRLGSWYHAFQTRINRRYLKMDTQNLTIKPLSELNAINKGIEFFYQLIFYCIAIGFPFYEIYRNVVDSKAKEKKLKSRVQKIENRITKIKEKVSKLQSSNEVSDWEVRHLSFEIINKFCLFCITPIHEQLSCCIELLQKHTKYINSFTIQPKNNKMCLLI